MSSNITCIQMRKAFESKNQVEFRTGKEPTGWIVENGKRVARITIPKGNKEIPVGTLSNMAKYLCVSRDQLIEYVKCNLKGSQLLEIIMINKQA